MLGKYYMTKITAALLFVFILCWVSCKKTAGPGGQASIHGKVYVKDFNTAATATISEYYGAGETVYIVYGNNSVVGNTVKTSTDGSFAFEYLREGKYTVYALSRDTSIHVSGSNKTIPVSTDVNITSNKQKFYINDIVINK